MPRKRVLTAERVTNELAKIAVKLGKGEIDRKDATALATVWGKCLYGIQVQSAESALKTREMYEDLLAAMSTHDTAIIQKYLTEGEPNDG